jgi:CO/xanthine dehydrogenase Mo-binding subunit
VEGPEIRLPYADLLQHHFGMPEGIGESGLMSTAPAIANALARATGLRLKALPLTPERIRQAMQDNTLGHQCK